MNLQVFTVCVLSHSIMTDFLQPHGLWPIRLLCPWDFPGKNNEVGFHFLLQGIFLTQGRNPRLLHWQVDSLLLSHQGSILFLVITRCYSLSYLKRLWLSQVAEHLRTQTRGPRDVSIQCLWAAVGGGHSWLSQYQGGWEGGGRWHLGGSGQGCWQTSSRAQGSSQHKEWSSPKGHQWEAEKPRSTGTGLLVGLWAVATGKGTWEFHGACGWQDTKRLAPEATTSE